MLLCCAISDYCIRMTSSVFFQLWSQFCDRSGSKHHVWCLKIHLCDSEMILSCSHSSLSIWKILKICYLWIVGNGISCVNWASYKLRVTFENSQIKLLILIVIINNLLFKSHCSYLSFGHSTIAHKYNPIKPSNHNNNKVMTVIDLISLPKIEFKFWCQECTLQL